MNPELGGGALLDAGSYPLSLIRLVMGCAPSQVQADVSWSDTGVDISASATLYFADGRRALRTSPPARAAVFSSPPKPLLM